VIPHNERAQPRTANAQIRRVQNEPFGDGTHATAGLRGRRAGQIAQNGFSPFSVGGSAPASSSMRRSTCWSRFKQ